MCSRCVLHLHVPFPTQMCVLLVKIPHVHVCQPPRRVLCRVKVHAVLLRTARQPPRRRVGSLFVKSKCIDIHAEVTEGASATKTKGVKVYAVSNSDLHHVTACSQVRRVHRVKVHAGSLIRHT